MALPRIAWLPAVLGLLTGLDTPRSHPPATRRAHATRPATQVPEARLIDSLLARMTLEEKLGQLNPVAGLSDTAATADDAPARERREGGLPRVSCTGHVRAAPQQ